MPSILVAGIMFVNFWTTPPSARLSLFSSGIIPVCNLGIGLKVCSSLYLVAIALFGRGSGFEPEGQERENP